MALVAIVEVTSMHACRLSKEDEQKVLKYIEDTDMPLDDAIQTLYTDGAINLFENVTESEVYTNYVVECHRTDK